MADKFVRMSRDGETIEVNPLCVADHERLGWQVVDDAPQTAEGLAPAAEPDPVPPEKPKRKKESRA